MRFWTDLDFNVKSFIVIFFYKRRWWERERKLRKREGDKKKIKKKMNDYNDVGCIKYRFQGSYFSGVSIS